MSNDFAAVFGVEPEATASAPGRVNLLGEHTDYNDGYVLPIAIPQTTMVRVARGAGGHVAYSANLDRMEHFGDTGPLADFARYVGGCLRVLGEEGIAVPPLRIWIETNVPIGAGLSSSAALEVATLRAVSALLGLGLDPVRLAQLAQRAEIEHAGVACGIMDQMAASLATTDAMLFLDTMTLAQRLLPLPTGAELLVVHSGVHRALTSSAYNTRRQECAEAARRLAVKSLRQIEDPADLAGLDGVLLRRARHVVTENRRVLAALAADAPAFGELINASHASLSDDFEVSLPAVDALVARMQSTPGVFGARMTGGGFGGCCIALVEAGRAASIGQHICSSAPTAGRSVIVPAGDI